MHNLPHPLRLLSGLRITDTIKTILDYNMKKLLLAILFLTPVLLSALSYDFIPYQGKSKKITTDNFVVIYPEIYEEEGKKTALYAEEIFTYLSPYFDWDPWLKITIILTDHTDIPNGMAYPVPRSTIQLRLTPSDSAISLRDFEDPLYSLLLHEMAHALHLDQIRGGAWFWRVLYGRLYFPNVNAFRWYHEGTAVLVETIFAEGGRLDSHYNEALVRNMVLENKLPSFDRLVLPVVDYPHGQATYHLGARFIEWLIETYGEEKFRTFFIDQSNDFFPFICEFVLKFKKIYGKPLRMLWDEWRIYETERYKNIVFEQDIAHNALTDLKGKVSSLTFKSPAAGQAEPELLFASSSYSGDAHVYTLTADTKELEKVKSGKVKSVTYTNNPDYILTTAITPYPGGLEYYDIYSVKISTGVEKRLTKKGRIQYIAFSQTSERGVFVQNLYNKAALFSARFTGNSLEDIQEIELPEDFSFIGPPSFDDNQSKVLFSARREKENYLIYVYDLDNGQLEQISSIKGRNPAWLDRNNFTFIGHDVTTDSLFSYDIETGSLYKVAESKGFIMEGLVIGDTVYYIDFTDTGEELFKTAYSPIEYSYDFNRYDIHNRPAHFDSTGDLTIPDFTPKTYNPLAYLYPTTWAFFPVQLNSYFRLNGLNIPIVGPQFMIYNRLPLGRFNYSIWVTLDYMKLYPENGLNLYWKLPYINMSYSWHNWASGFRAFVVTGLDGRTYVNNLGNRYPIAFSNKFTLSTQIPVGPFAIGGFASTTHVFDEYNFFKRQRTNTLTFSEGISFAMTDKRARSSRWDKGFSAEIQGYQSPPILDNDWYYLLKANVTGRIPIGSAYFFIDLSGGVDFLLQDKFTVGTNSLIFNSTILGSGSSSVNRIDTKAFGDFRFFGPQTYPTGAAYFASDIGFDISIYKRTHYIHFLTLGFKEFYIRPYTEFVYLYSRNSGNNFVIDGAVEFCVDLFMFYGNISIKIINGFAGGYHFFNSYPTLNIYSYVSIGL